MTVPEFARLNVGCGQTPTPGWRNFDYSPSVRLARRPILTRLLRALGLLDNAQWGNIQYCRSSDIQWADCTRLPLPDGSAEVLYSSHMLEHLDRQQSEKFLHEAFRVLIPGGIPRLAVPDLHLFVAEYVDNGDGDRLLGRMHMNMSRPGTFAQRLRYLLVGPRNHLWMYDAASLGRLLAACGYGEVRVTAAGDTTIANPGALNLRERESERLYVEARKPRG